MLVMQFLYRIPHLRQELKECEYVIFCSKLVKNTQSLSFLLRHQICKMLSQLYLLELFSNFRGQAEPQILRLVMDGSLICISSILTKRHKASSRDSHPSLYQPLYLSLAALWHDTYSPECTLSLYFYIFSNFVSYQNTRTMLYLNKIGERRVI